MKAKSTYKLFSLLLSGTLIVCNVSPVFAQDVKREATHTPNEHIIEQKTTEEAQQKLIIDENFDLKKEEPKEEDNQISKENQEPLKTEEKKETEKTEPIAQPAPTPTTASSEEIPTETKKKNPIQKPDVNYSSYIQNNGWQKGVTNGFVSGTVGKAYPIEAININLSTHNDEIFYRIYCGNTGWTNWSNGGSTNRTLDKAHPIEAMQIKLSDELEENFDIYYRVYDGETGWLNWVKNGDIAGLPDQDSTIEAYQIKLVEKDKELEDKEPQIKSCSADLKDIDVINAHVAIDHSENVTNVKFVVWSSEIGMNDGKWYQGYYANGQWSALINIDEHQIKSGEYQICCYVDCVNKNTIEESCKVVVPDRKTTITRLEKQDDKETYRINITNVPSSVEEVLISTRNEESEKNDIVWHKAKKITNHEYQVNVESFDNKEIMDVKAYGKVKGLRRVLNDIPPEGQNQ